MMLPTISIRLSCIQVAVASARIGSRNAASSTKNRTTLSIFNRQQSNGELQIRKLSLIYVGFIWYVV